MPDPWALIRKTAVNTSLVLASLLLCAVVGEGYLRFFHPVYEYAAEAPYYLDHRRIYVREANSASSRPHPDTGVRHNVIYNNLALRQHRNFSEDDLAGAINVGIFGDSFTENLRLPAPYLFVEVLDYLLSQTSRQNDTRQRFNVLNFGVEGYGTDQAFLYYDDFAHSSKLDVVVYLFCVNDLKDIHANELLLVNKSGRLTRNARPEIASSPWISLLSELHITYLVVDGTKRFANLIGENTSHFLNDAQTSFERAGYKREWRKKHRSAEAKAVSDDILDGIADSERAKGRYRNISIHTAHMASDGTRPWRTIRRSYPAPITGRQGECADSSEKQDSQPFSVLQ